MADEQANPADSPPPQQPTASGSGTVWKFVVAFVVLLILYELLRPKLYTPPEARHRSRCRRHLRQIGIALHNYYDKYRALPPPYTVDKNGNRLHSWRTLILPFIERDDLYIERSNIMQLIDLYAKIDLSKPWNHPANAAVFEQPMYFYCCKSASFPKTHTSYMVIVSPDSLFPPGQSRHFRDVKDGTANTVMVAEMPADQAVHWMSPYDASEEAFVNINVESELVHENLQYILWGDGATRSIRFDTTAGDFTAEERRAFVTIAGKEMINWR